MALTGVFLTNTADQTITSTESLLDWTTSAEHNGDWWENVTNSERITIPTGISLVKVYWGGYAAAFITGGDDYFCRLKKNGAAQNVDLWNESGYCGHHRMSGLVAVTPGDYFEVSARSYGDSFDWLSEYTYFAMFDPESIIGHVVAYIPSNLAISAAHNVITWDTPAYDNLSTFNGTTGFTVPTGASYAIPQIAMRCQSANSGRYIFEVKIDGVTYNRYDTDSTLWAAGGSMGVVPVTAGDVLTFTIYAQNNDTVNASETFVSIEWLGE